jgi:hypothetical protein
MKEAIWHVTRLPQILNRYAFGASGIELPLANIIITLF